VRVGATLEVRILTSGSRAIETRDFCFQSARVNQSGAGSDAATLTTW
jgi:hypothetical protein